MPNIIIGIEENSSKIIVGIPAGKQYLSEIKSLEQNAQKGGTCWYYIYNLLRLRLGKKFEEKELVPIKQKLKVLANTPEDKAGIKDKVIEYLQLIEELEEKRKIEKTVSHFRKMITNLDYKKNVVNFLQSEYKKMYGNKKCTASNALNFLNLIKKAHKEKLISDEYLNEAELFINNFRKREITLDIYLQKLEDEDYIKRIAITLKAFEDLKLNYSCYLKKQIELRHPNVNDISELDLSSQHDIYRYAFFAAILDKYDLQPSTWNPISNGIDGLMSALRREGALAVTGLNGKGYYNSAPQLSVIDKIPDSNVYFWEPGAYKNSEELKEMPLHAILIVGAEKRETLVTHSPVETKSTNPGFIYFIDPNDSSKPNESRKLYKISYKRLQASLRNIHDQIIPPIPPNKSSHFLNKIGLLMGPFAIRANEESRNKLISKYKEMQEFLNRETPTLGTNNLSISR